MELNESSPTRSFNKLAKKQFWRLYDSVKLDIDDDTKFALLPQSVLGRAQEGHGIFNGERYPNATMEQIISAIGIDPKIIKHYRQNMVNDFFECVKRLMEGKTRYLINKEGKPIYGINFLKDMPLELEKETFQGAVLIGRMDSIKWRIKTVEHYKTDLEGKTLRIGGGDTFPVDINILPKMSLTFEDLAKKEHTEEIINEYKEKGLIREGNINGKNIESIYIRYKKGLGVCDDASLISVGKLKGQSAMILGQNIDTTDTYDKFIEEAKIGGTDGYIAEYIAQKWKEKYNEDLVTPEECMEIIYLGAKNNYPKISLSNSHRRFVQYEEGSSKPTFLHHLDFVKYNKTADFRMGFQKMGSKEFYKNIQKRFELYNKGDLIPQKKEDKLPRKLKKNLSKTFT